MFSILRDLYTFVGFYVLAVYSVAYEFYIDRICTYNGQPYLKYLQTVAKKSNFVRRKKHQRYALITGGNGAIGREIVKALLQLGFKVICLNREEDQFSELPHPDDVTVRYIDLTDLRRVKRVAQDIGEKIDVDLVVCNAGVLLVPYKTTSDGFETHYAVNLLSHAVLIETLLKARRESHSSGDKDNSEVRVAFISSVTAHLGDISRQPTNNDSLFKYYLNGYHAYSTSKLALSIYAKMLHLHSGQSPSLKAISLHPGVVSSNLYRYANSLSKSLIYGPLQPYMRSSAVAAAEILACICNDTLLDGCYHQYMKPVKLQNAGDETMQKQLYEKIQHIVQNVQN